MTGATVWIMVSFEREAQVRGGKNYTASTEEIKEYKINNRLNNFYNFKKQGCNISLVFYFSDPVNTRLPDRLCAFQTPLIPGCLTVFAHFGPR